MIQELPKHEDLHVFLNQKHLSVETTKTSTNHWQTKLLHALKGEGDTDLQHWAEPILELLAQKLSALQATLYFFDEEEQKLKLAAWYSPIYPDKIPQTVELGHGTVGRAAKTHKTIRTNLQGMGCFSGTTVFQPDWLLTLPLLNNYKLAGVFECTTFEQEADPLAQQEFDAALPFVASALHSILKEKQLLRSLAELRDEREHLQTLASVGTEGVAFIDNFRIIDHNYAFTQMFGFQSQELEGMHLAELLKDNIFSEINFADEAFAEVEARRNDGSIFVAEMQLRRVLRQRRQMMVLTLRDISQRKAAEMQLADSQQKLQAAEQVIFLTKEIEEKNKKITASINYAKNIQEALLPKQSEIAQQLAEYFIFYQCKDVVSGDFYWHYASDANTCYLAAVDCTGHGVPGAFMSFVGYTHLTSVVKHQGFDQPEAILKQLDQEVVNTLRQNENKNSRDGMDVGLLKLQLDTRQWSFAGAHRPMVMYSNGHISEIKGSKCAIGGCQGTKKNKEIEATAGQWKSGDMCYLFSDGYADQFNLKGEKFMAKRLKKLFQEIGHLPANEQHNILKAQFEQWKLGSTQMDDVLIIGVRLP